MALIYLRSEDNSGIHLSLTELLYKYLKEEKFTTMLHIRATEVMAATLSALDVHMVTTMRKITIN